jgi:nitroreductase
MSDTTPNPTLEFLRRRRSLKPDKLAEPGPSADQLTAILTLAARVPDHKKLAPWRFVVFSGDARAKMGEVFVQACIAEDKEPPSPVRLDFERCRFLRAPLVVGVVSRVVDSAGAPEWEQVLSAGAACFNMCLAANALGFGTCWITEWVAYSPAVSSALKLGPRERIAGFVYIGTASEHPADRDRPELASLVSHWLT